MITNKRRIILVTTGLIIGTSMSVGIFMFKNKSSELNQHDIASIIGNFLIAGALIFGMGFIFLWRKRNP